MDAAFRQLLVDTTSDESSSESDNDNPKRFRRIAKVPRAQKKKRPAPKKALVPAYSATQTRERHISFSQPVSSQAFTHTQAPMAATMSSKQPPTKPVEDNSRPENPLQDKSPSSTSGKESTNFQPATSPLDFPLSKLVFIFEKMVSQSPSVEMVGHATKLVCANEVKLQRASCENIAQLMASIITGPRYELVGSKFFVGQIADSSPVRLVELQRMLYLRGP